MTNWARWSRRGWYPGLAMREGRRWEVFVTAASGRVVLPFDGTRHCSPEMALSYAWQKLTKK